MCASALHVVHNNFEQSYHFYDINSGKYSAVSVYISARWLHMFCERHSFVSNDATSKVHLSAAKKSFILRNLAYHCGFLFSEIRVDEHCKDYTENSDKPNFLFNVDNGRALGFKGDEDIEWRPFVYRSMEMTTVIRIFRRRKTELEESFMVFLNQDRNTPTLCDLDSIETLS